MKSVCLFFQVHQPFRYRRYRFFDIGNDHYYYDDYANDSILKRVAENCYLPANKLLLDLIQKSGGKLKLAFSVSGSVLDQFEIYAPEVIESFQELANTGCVEFLGETYSHSLVSLANKQAFEKQVLRHTKKITTLFGKKPKVFANTEMIYSDEIGSWVAEMGFEGILTEGAKHILGWKSPNFLYVNAMNPRLKVLMRNIKLSDDLIFKFADFGWAEYPLTADKYAGWLTGVDKNDEIINLFMNYELFGEIHKKSTGIFDFLAFLPSAILATGKLQFSTPSEIIHQNQPKSVIHIPQPISWAGEERDLAIWLGNELQDEAFQKLYNLEKKIDKCSDPEILKDWDYLQICDNFRFMSERFSGNDENYFRCNPFHSPYEAFINFMNILADFKLRLSVFVPEKKVQRQIASLTKIIEERDTKIKKYEDEIRMLQKRKKSSGN
jgi:alpha-amylase